MRIKCLICGYRHEIPDAATTTTLDNGREAVRAFCPGGGCPTNQGSKSSSMHSVIGA